MVAEGQAKVLASLAGQLINNVFLTLERDCQYDLQSQIKLIMQFILLEQNYNITRRVVGSATYLLSKYSCKIIHFGNSVIEELQVVLGSYK